MSHVTPRELLRRARTLRTIAFVWALIFLPVFGAAGLAAAAAGPVPDFSFIHISDEHVYHSGTQETIAELATIGEVDLKPYGVTAVAPSFIIETGDMTEFGPKAGAWNTLDNFYSSVTLPRYRSLGNHDEVWRSLSYEIRQLHGAPYYSFDKFGCHFVVLNSAGLQDPRPVISPEELAWLKKDLESISADTPLFVACHHPLDTREYSSAYETDRLLDILRPYNLIAVLVGHSHGHKHVVYRGVDMVYGGSAWGPGLPGFQVFSVRDGTLRVAYKERGKPAAETPTLEKPLAPPEKRYPAITIEAPLDRAAYRSQVPVKARIAPRDGEAESAYAEVDGGKRIDLERKRDGSFGTVIPLSDLAPGAHYMKVSFVGAGGAVYDRSCCFYVDLCRPEVKWRTFTESASKSTPAVSDDTVYVGGNDGRMRAYNRATGELRWEFATGGAVTSEPLLLRGRVYFGSEDKHLYCLWASDGSEVWRFEADDPVYSSPVSDGDAIYFGCGNGTFYSLGVLSGILYWKNTDATYNIESKPFVADGKVCYGAWDTYVYCLSTFDGALQWKCMGQGSAEGVAPAYYSPADCGPVVSQGRAYAPDRKYRMSVIDADTGALLSFVDKVSAVGLAGDGGHLYLRKTDGTLVKMGPDGEQVWSAAVRMDEAPAAPREVGGVVYVSSKRGLVSAVSADTGAILWQYQATPSSYILSSINASGSTAYVCGTDGSLTALAN